MRVNPEVVKVAAELVHHKAIENDGAIWVVPPPGCKDFLVEFNPLTSDDDAMKLERQLRKDGWRFWSYPDGHAFAENRRRMIETIHDSSDTLLLLKCVAYQHGLELYV